MKGSTFISLLGIIISIPLMIFAIQNNYWAEPSAPDIRPAFYVVIDH